MSRDRMQASTERKGGLRGMTTLVWNRGTHCARADALQGRISPTRDRVAPADLSGLVAQVLVTIPSVSPFWQHALAGCGHYLMPPTVRALTM